MSSLVQRLLTAVILIPLVVWVVLYAPESVFLWVLSGIVFIAAMEWAALTGVACRGGKIIFALPLLVLCHALLMVNATVVSNLMLLSLVFWLFVIIFVLSMPAYLMAMRHDKKIMAGLGYVLLSLTFVSLYQLRHVFEHGPDLMMYLLLLIWIADSGAYFAGRTLGQHKLSAIISPGKSIEGVIGGLLTCLLFAIAATGYFSIEYPAAFILLSLSVVVVSVFGDLFESLLKRRAKVKDSGNILPGHGGVLDRIDSLIAAAPVFFAGLLLTGMFA